MSKVFLDMVGCRLNQAEIERLARQFLAAGCEVVPSADQADLAVVNTCTVTSQAAADSRQKVRQAGRRAGRVVATGCWASLEPQAAAALPGVSRVVSNDRKEALVSDLLDLDVAPFEHEPLARQPLPGLRRRTRAFIKVQDGCDNTCTYCITRIARGAGRSMPVEAVLADVQAALDGGTREVVLTGVHLGSWGGEFGCHLGDLVAALLAETDLPRLRLSSVEPWDLEAGFFDLWRDPRLCRHLHLPLQSGSAAVLKRMARKTTPASFAALLDSARRTVPGLAVTTDVIAGFPGESEMEFSETLDYVRAMGFAGGHVFAFSPRPGTAAARLEGQAPMELRKERSAILRQAFDESAQVFRRRFVGQTVEVLWESAIARDSNGWTLGGLTDNYLRVEARSPRPLWNEITRVRLVSLSSDELTGELVGSI